MKLPPTTLVLALAATLFASCAPNTPQRRIEDSPSRFGNLSASDKALVRQGKIRTGMTQDAVYLAWGRPQSVSKGGVGNASTERWSYTGTTPVWTNHFNVAYGGGYGYGYGLYYDYGPSVAYIPYTAGVVHFTNGRVSKWEETGR